MPESHFDHGDLPARAGRSLSCPAVRTEAHASSPAYAVAAVPGSGYRAKFRCSSCGFEFTASDAQLRRIAGG
jgi:hypothetical protein